MRQGEVPITFTEPGMEPAALFSGGLVNGAEFVFCCFRQIGYIFDMVVSIHGKKTKVFAISGVTRVVLTKGG